MKTDVKELDQSYEMDIDLPGFKKDEVNVELENGYLTISAAKGLDRDQKDSEGRYIRQERYSGQCSGASMWAISARGRHRLLRGRYPAPDLPKAGQPKLPEQKRIAIQ